MDFQFLFNGAVSVIFLLSGWFIRTIYDAIRDLKEDIREVEREIHNKYVRKDDYREDMAQIREELKDIKRIMGSIYDKLDNKADK